MRNADATESIHWSLIGGSTCESQRGKREIKLTRIWCCGQHIEFTFLNRIKMEKYTTVTAKSSNSSVYKCSDFEASFNIFISSFSFSFSVPFRSVKFFRVRDAYTWITRSNINRFFRILLCSFSSLFRVKFEYRFDSVYLLDRIVDQISQAN